MTHKLEIAVASNDVEGCLKVASSVDAHLYVDDREDVHGREGQGLPFRALLTAITDDLTPLAAVADVGLYVTCRRVVKPGAAKKIALFPMVHRADRTRAECDGHWRDRHAPLALIHHPHMTQYVQLSVLYRLSGLDVQGFAMCGFESVADIRERFFAGEESVGIIQEDVRRFADPRRSPRRLIVTPVS